MLPKKQESKKLCFIAYLVYPPEFGQRRTLIVERSEHWCGVRWSVELIIEDADLEIDSQTTRQENDS